MPYDAGFRPERDPDEQRRLIESAERNLLLSAMQRFGYKYSELLDEDEELLRMLIQEAEEVRNAERSGHHGPEY